MDWHAFNLTSTEATVIFTCCADGSLLEPRSFMSEKYSEDTTISPDVLKYFINDFFYPTLVAKNVTFPVLLLLDGNRFNLFWELFELCKSLKIILLNPYPHFDKLIQPFEIAIANLIRIYWDKFLMDKKYFEVNDLNLTMILNAFGQSYFRTGKIRYAFAVSGIFPWNQKAINYKQFVDMCKRESGQKSAVYLVASCLIHHDEVPVLPALESWSLVSYTRPSYQKLDKSAKEIALVEWVLHCSRAGEFLNSSILSCNLQNVLNFKVSQKICSSFCRKPKSSLV